ncbi:unnamed protein product [Pieris brassicae]|uniref:F-box domain-containing protein n=1 Tax=Pieris brassicae TaxID=7116 RepID=A0A9P0TU41_PIEBR|nr:unnamed protein product [Pieris brassicae]
MSAFITINSLPIEIFIEFFIKLDGYSLMKCREVCKKWKEAIDNNDILWQEVCRKEFKKSSRIAKKKSGDILTELPDGKFPVQLDVCERRSGPTIVAATFFELYMIDVKFFPGETTVKNTFTSNKLNMYKRLRCLKERLQSTLQQQDVTILENR